MESKRALIPALVLLAGLAAWPAMASSHREAPAILDMPEVDGADFYMFRSYEAGRAGFVTLIADYNPLQDPFGGPNYFPLRDDAFYDIRIDNNGDAVEDLTFRFRFTNALPVVVPGNPGLGVPVPLPNGTFVPVGISAVAPFGPGTPPPPPGGALNWIRSYTVRLVRGPMDHPTGVAFLSNADNNSTRFPMPFDNIGMKTIPLYDAYAAQFIFPVNIPGCGAGRLFVGQRKEPFAVNLGDFFDLVNVPNPLGPRAAQPNSLADKNITSLALEVPIACLNPGADGVVAGWTTAQLLRFRELVNNPTFDQPFIESGDYVQVSRLANPLVNELDIALAKKNLFNASQPKNDAQFQVFFQTPTVPVGIQLVAGVPPPTNIPRNDLVAFFLNGLPGLNADNSGGEVLRLNTGTPPVAAALQNNLGFLGGDAAGWPNGRRPGDDVVDITLRVLEGALCFQGFTFCNSGNVPAGQLPLTDQTWVDAGQFDPVFPYLQPPIPGAPNPTRIFNSFLAGTPGLSGTCTSLVTTDESQLTVSCTHDLSGATSAQITQGGVVVCALPSAASPIQTVCPLTPAQLDALQKGQLTVTIVSPGGTVSGTLQ